MCIPPKEKYPNNSHPHPLNLPPHKQCNSPLTLSSKQNVTFKVLSSFHTLGRDGSQSQVLGVKSLETVFLHYNCPTVVTVRCSCHSLIVYVNIRRCKDRNRRWVDGTLQGAGEFVLFSYVDRLSDSLFTSFTACEFGCM